MATKHTDIAEEGELFCTHIGGSATLEGVMMRGKLNWAVAVRCEDGSIYVEEHDLPDASSRPAWFRWPIVRGCVSFAESMMLAYRALDIASEHVFIDEEDEGQEGAPSDSPEHEQNDTEEKGGVMGIAMAVSACIGVLIGIALFILLPLLITNLVVGELNSGNSLVWSLVEALLRMVVLVAYVGGVGLIPDMARMYGYHGAEHQSIHCFEHGLPLTPENAARFSRLHVRCGTAFLVMTVGIALILHAVVPVGAWAEALGLSGIARTLFVMGSRLILLPIVAGVSYEVTVKWAGSHPDNPLVKIALWPGLQMQRLTTRKADPGMLECAIEALKRVDAREKAAAAA
ncbi:MAG TPA: DUF1385 domain-containing protein [Collinsella ihuae]|uniref:DUF1385 domain-containing protein n=1 Tax=Collinsella ihumii TaxID=1720204 RepID=A0A921ISK3_9ACTN|nr:DUF1385 domain-containing protein [Collinsella ihumii]